MVGVSALRVIKRGKCALWDSSTCLNFCYQWTQEIYEFQFLNELLKSIFKPQNPLSLTPPLFIDLHRHDDSVTLTQDSSRSWRSWVNGKEWFRLGSWRLYIGAIFCMKLPLSLVWKGFIHSVKFHKRIDFCPMFEGAS